MFWWWVKVFCGVVLIAGVFLRFLSSHSVSQLSLPTPIAQLLVVTGGLLYVWHFILIKRANRKIDQPDHLVEQGGLFSLVRHPMYFADMIYYFGLALLWPSLISAGVMIVAIVALIRQSKQEDLWCAEQFPIDHATWVNHTKLVIPFVY